MQQHAGQRIAIALTTGKHADSLKNIVLGKKKATEQAAQFGLRGARRGFEQVIQHARLRIESFVLVLAK